MTKSTKNIISITLMGVLALVAVFLVTKYQKNTLQEELSDFDIKDTASIDKIFLSDKDGYKSLLERKSAGSWMVNGSFEARPDVITTLLETMTQLRVKAPVGRSSFNTVIKSLSVKSTKVDIYQKGKLVKTYYVGGATDDLLGTYMMIEHSSAPFIMYIPGFDGYLYTRYYAVPELWRSTALYKLRAQDIKSIKYVNNQIPNESWELKQNQNNTLELFNNQGEAIPLFDTLKARAYLTQFYKINCESYVNDIEPERKDSILSSAPRAIFTVTPFKGAPKELKCFTKKLMVETFDMMGQPMDIDVDRFYGMINNNKKELLQLQNFVFDNLLVPNSHFVSESKKLVKK